MIQSANFHPPEASDPSFTIMRALVIFCLLHAAFHETMTSAVTWQPLEGQYDQGVSDVCVGDHSACGCCLMDAQLSRFRKYFNYEVEYLRYYLTEMKDILMNRTANRVAFSVALNNDNSLTCLGPFAMNTVIPYNNIFINLGDGYDSSTGTFTVSRSGVYSLSVTIYMTGQENSACVSLMVNSENTQLHEHAEDDTEDSNTVVMTQKLRVGDQVAVELHEGCTICDDNNHYNTFTGFLVYATDEVS